MRLTDSKERAAKERKTEDTLGSFGRGPTRPPARNVRICKGPPVHRGVGNIKSRAGALTTGQIRGKRFSGPSGMAPCGVLSGAKNRKETVLRQKNEKSSALKKCWPADKPREIKNTWPPGRIRDFQRGGG